jgi:hypothetical protein
MYTRIIWISVSEKKNRGAKKKIGNAKKLTHHMPFPYPLKSTSPLKRWHHRLSLDFFFYFSFFQSYFESRQSVRCDLYRSRVMCTGMAHGADACPADDVAPSRRESAICCGTTRGPAVVPHVSTSRVRVGGATMSHARVDTSFMLALSFQIQFIMQWFIDTFVMVNM